MSEVFPEIAQTATDLNNGFAFRSNFGKRRKSNRQIDPGRHLLRHLLLLDLSSMTIWLIEDYFVYFDSFQFICWFNLWNFCQNFELIFCRPDGV